mmetsp:Transcript_2783/g.3506  ORF Transcript_2783/g.3506 Transcript_2783/m.3506 type:complete len:269 (-) Transcript_2783:379-1185(-)
MSSALISMGLASSSLASAPSSAAFFFASSFFLASIAFLLCGSLKSFCFLRHSPRTFCHFDHSSLNHAPGCKSSTRCVSFFCEIHSFSRLAHAASSCHAKDTASKPSSLVGRAKLAYHFPITASVSSGVSSLRYHIFFSSSVNSTGVSSASILESSFASSAGASSLASSTSFPAFFFCAASLAFLASSAFFFFSSSNLLRSSSWAFFLFSASALLCLSERIKAWTFCLCSSLGSPMMTVAVRVNSGPPNPTRAFLRSSDIRLERSSGMM